MSLSKLSLMVFALCVLVSFSARAEVLEELKGSAAGAGAIYHTNPYTGADDQVYPAALVSLKYKKLYVDGSVLGYILNNNEKLELSLVLSPRFMGYDSGDSDDLSGMDDREWSMDGGARLVWNNDFFKFSLTALNDLMGNHEGFEVSAMVSREFWKGCFTPRIGVKLQSKDLIDYYYGVKASEVIAGRPEYNPDEAVNAVAGARIAVPLGEKWALVVDCEYENLNSEIGNSPIVDRDKLYTYIAGLVYRF